MGYVGAVTEDLPALVSPAGIADIDVTDIVTEVNAAAADLTAGGADLVVMLVHEGAAEHRLRHDGRRPGSTFGNIVTNVSARRRRDRLRATPTSRTTARSPCEWVRGRP